MKKINKLAKNSKSIKPLVVLESLLNIIKGYNEDSRITAKLIQEKPADKQS